MLKYLTIFVIVNEKTLVSMSDLWGFSGLEVYYVNE